MSVPLIGANLCKTCLFSSSEITHYERSKQKLESSQSRDMSLYIILFTPKSNFFPTKVTKVNVTKQR